MFLSIFSEIYRLMKQQYRLMDRATEGAVAVVSDYVMIVHPKQ